MLKSSVPDSITAAVKSSWANHSNVAHGISYRTEERKKKQNENKIIQPVTQATWEKKEFRPLWEGS